MTNLFRVQYYWNKSIWGTGLTRANLKEIINDLRASLLGTIIDQAKISGCTIYGVNVWDLEVNLKNREIWLLRQKGQSITVDNIKVAQFIYLILNE